MADYTKIYCIEENVRDKIALIDDQGYCMTYSELDRIVNEIAGVCVSSTLVMMLCKNSVAAVAGYVGFVSNGIVPLMTSYYVSDESINNIIKVYKPRYLYVPVEKKNEYDSYQMIWKIQGYCVLQSVNWVDYEIHPELEVLLSTSGSTGSPKYVRMGRNAFQISVSEVTRYCEYCGNERFITLSPVSYMLGLHRIRCHLYMGNTILLTDKKVMEKEFWDFYDENQATSFAAVPYVFEMLDRMKFFDDSSNGMYRMTVAGGKISDELRLKICQYAKKNNVIFEMMYGTTEVCCDNGLVCYPKEDIDIGENCIGKPLSTMQWNVLNAEKENIDLEYEEGELCIQSKCCMLGYAENYADLSKGDEVHGVYSTGDIVYKGSNGYYYFVARNKRIEKIFGNRVSLDEIEKIVKEYLCTNDCVCIGRENHITVLVLPPYYEKKREILKRLVAGTGMVGSVFEIDIIEEIPRSSGGKVLYGEIEKMREDTL